MKRENNEIKLDLSVSDAELFEDTFAGFEENAEATDAEKQRILSSVMRKAGYEMNGIIKENNNFTAAKTDNDTLIRRGSIRLKRGGAIAACIAVLAVGAVTAGIFYSHSIRVTGPSSSEMQIMNDFKITLPNFVGNRITSVMSDYGSVLNIHVIREQNSEYEAGIIFEQNITAGRTVDQGTDITFKVSIGKAMGVVPDVTEAEQELAENELRAAQFSPVIKEIYDEEVPEGYVVKTDPAIGSKAALQSEVILYISKGSFEGKVEVPDLISLTYEEAEAKLTECGLEISKEDVPNSAAEGTVVDQSIEPGMSVDKDTVITIYTSTGIEALVDMSVGLAIPNGLTGSYSVYVYKDDSVLSADTIPDASDVAGGTFYLKIQGYGKDTLTFRLTNNETGKSVDYMTVTVNYDLKTVEVDENSPDTEGLLATAEK